MTITDEMLEAAAKASYETMAFPGDFGTVKWDGLSPFDRKIYKMRARAALTAVLPMMDGWQPIETAPKDKPLLVYHPGLGMGGHNVMRLDNDGWIETANDGRRLKAGYEPSHWRPLPPPPKGDGT